METIYYPKISINQIDNVLILRTTLRKEKHGIWYKWEFYRETFIKTDEEKINSINFFHQEVYCSIILGNPDPNIYGQDGQPIFKKDSIQENEVDRMSNLIQSRLNQK